MAKNTGKYELSAEGRRAHNTLCKDLKNIHETNRDEAGEQLQAGDLAGALDSAYVAASAQADAQKFGCKWAS